MGIYLIVHTCLNGIFLFGEIIRRDYYLFIYFANLMVLYVQFPNYNIVFECT